MILKPETRIRFITFCVLFVALLYGVRLYFLQVVSHNIFEAKADSQYLQAVSSTFERGIIYFENKDGSLASAATLKTGYTIAVNPMLIKDVEGAYEKLHAIVPTIDREEFIRRATKENDPYEEVAKRVNDEDAQKIRELELVGVGVYKEKWRLYSYNDMASHVLGFVGYKGDILTGRYGLERYYDATLERNTGEVYVNFFAEMFSSIKSIASKEVEGDIVATIDPSVQAFLEREIDNVMTTYRPTQAGAIIMDPMTGRVVGMASRPAFNPNLYSTVEDQSVFTNPLVESVYEMGSIVKPLTIAAGIDAGEITAKTTYYDQGYLTLNNKTIYNFDRRGRGTVTMEDVLSQSLNTGVAYIADKLGKGGFRDYMLRFGVGSKTGIDLPNESGNLIDNLNSPRDIEHATASYGHGIALTPISTVRALAALANGGTLVTPHLVKEVREKGKLAKTIEYNGGPRAIKKETADEITRMLVKVVDTALLEGTVKKDHYSIAAKTGTALLPNSEGGYHNDRFLHSFFGYFPAYKPEYIIFLFAVDPKGEMYSSHTLTRPFIDLADFLINYYSIPPDR